MQNNMAGKWYLRWGLVVILFLMVKGPETFSEEHHHHNYFGVGKPGKIVLNGKIFPVILVAPTSTPAKAKATFFDNNCSLNINGKGKLPPEWLAAFLMQHNPALDPDFALRFATIYVEEADDEGINHDLAFSQMCLETAFLKFGGDVQPEQNNFCGLGVTGQGVHGASFSDVRAGVRAHIQHLKAYSSNQNTVNPVIDRRFKYVKRGSALDAFDLTGKWATDNFYGEKIKTLMDKLFKVACQQQEAV